jgi:3-oxoacyl-[acyl-carrier protein] reductase
VSGDNGRPLGDGYRLAVIGSHGGIGSALCRSASALGARVAGLDTTAALAAGAGQSTALEFAVDVRDGASLTTAAAAIEAAWGGLDGFAYVTGVGSAPSPALASSVEDWDRTFSINLRGAFLTAAALHRLFPETGGSALFVASGLASNVEPGFAAYSASKAGLVAFAKTLAKEWAPRSRVNVVAPGLVETAFLGGGTGQALAREDASLESWFGAKKAADMLATIPLGRCAQPDDVVGPMLFLLGPMARFMTGQTLHVNGGRYMP